MKSIFDVSSYDELKTRVNNLNENSEANWGKMSVGQMVWHCQGPLNIMLQKEDYGLKPNWLAKVFFKKSLYNDRKWSKGLPTAKFLKTKEDKYFNTVVVTLKALLDDSHSHKDKTEWEPHPGFGYFTPEQWGQMQYKHLDHHLRQFGV